MMNKDELATELVRSLLCDRNKWSVNACENACGDMEHIDGISLEKLDRCLFFPAKVRVKIGRKHLTLDINSSKSVMKAMYKATRRIRIKEAEEFSNELGNILK